MKDACTRQQNKRKSQQNGQQDTHHAHVYNKYGKALK